MNDKEIETCDLRQSKIDAGAFSIDYSNGLLSMSKSMRDLEDYVEHMKNAVKKEKLAEIVKHLAEMKDVRELVDSLGKRKWYIVRNVIQLCNIIKWRFEVQNLNPVACTEVRLIEKFNNKASVANQIDKAVKLNVLVCCSQYSSYKLKQAKEYWFNKDAYEKLVNLYFDEYSDDELNDEIAQSKPEDDELIG